ncbi:hypothetical protein KEM60_02056 [Austwickia sp. TVS 96-490-7B]|uniref:mannosyltransferase family protein n=1 Tax=Austwickia sp. TVS 96-490-7B TaxID=2830843 RepID=UPI001C56EC83|nr:mannosyltransferase family protein [Austwickia sp. TVS 96-490-7B]MBW3085845.1 hypothetical protein [Austwickia sp. TVS 96-490-7B]
MLHRTLSALSRPWRAPLPPLFTWSFAGWACLVFAAVRIPAVLWIAMRVPARYASLGDLLSAWDGQWFAQIAAGGYDPHARGSAAVDLVFAFFPGYPGVVAAVQQVTGVSFVPAALTVSILASLGCAICVAEMGALTALTVWSRRATAEDDDSLLPLTADLVRRARQAGLIMVALFAGSPMAVVLTMTYTEALFCVLAAAAMVHMMRGRWLTAGVIVLLAGLVRPNAVALFLTLGLCALANYRQWRVWVATFIAPLGWLGYLAYVQHHLVRYHSWFEVQNRAWHSTFDFGQATLRDIGRVLTTDTYPTYQLAVLIIVATVLLCLYAVRSSVPWPLTVYGLAVVASVLLSDGVTASRPRLLTPAFTLYLPVALTIARLPRSVRVVAVSAWVVFGMYVGMHMMTVWPYPI